MISADEIKLNTYASFLDDIFAGLEEKGISVSNLELDHICYRVETIDRYNQLFSALSKNHELIIESKVNGRNISNFLLLEPIVYKDREIKVLELPEPKSEQKYSEGYEHVEFVVNETLEEFMVVYPKVEFDLKGLEKELNREVRLSLGSISVKFHEQSLMDVIKIEQANQSKGA